MGDNLPADPLGVFFPVFVDSGSEFNCAFDSNGEIKCWGKNEHGQLGLGNSLTRRGPDDLFGVGEPLPTVNLGTGLTVESVALAGSQACYIHSLGRRHKFAPIDAFQSNAVIFWCNTYGLRDLVARSCCYCSCCLGVYHHSHTSWSSKCAVCDRCNRSSYNTYIVAVLRSTDLS